ncbi:MAG: hypothetical protein JSR62_16975 [Nitrospira sp.]|nr:hypothetical protein [Nitrospira sp.]MBX3349067.1 hypothetical protein [Nitrospira sp.]MCW5793928.1 hypothetical protein [Nitrospira sp.]
MIRVKEGKFRLGPQPTLSQCERLVLQSLWAGKNSSQIAHELKLSTNCIKAVRHRLRRKYQASNAAQLVRAALAHGDLTTN